MTALAKCFPTTYRTSCDFLTDYFRFSRILTLYKVPKTVSLICSAFSGDFSCEETESVIQFVGNERVQFLTQETGAASPIISLVFFSVLHDRIFPLMLWSEFCLTRTS